MERRPRLLVALILLLTLAAGRAGVWADEPAKKAADYNPGKVEPVGPIVETPAKKQVEDDYELYQIFADTLDQVERNYVKDVSRRELMEAAIHGVLSKLDPYSNYISPEDISHFKTSVESQFGGIGIQIGIQEGQLIIISPLVGSPAYRAGLESGDTIVEIDGKTTEGIHIDEATKRLKGDAGTKVMLTVRHAGADKTETVTISRELVHVETVLGDHRKLDDSWDFMLDRDRHIGYVRISAFSRDTAQDLKKALVDLQTQGLKGLVLDLRFNPGGLLNSAIEVSDLFVAAGRIVSTQGRNTPERVWDAQQDGTFEGFKIAVLVNHYSASASEILSACLQDHHRAVVIGERTWGKGSVQNVIELEGGKSALKLTTASYLRPSGKNIHRFPESKETDEWGVLPDPGFEVKLNDSQTRQVDRRNRDRGILANKHKAAEPVAPPATDAAAQPVPAAPKTDQPAPPAAGDAKPSPEQTQPPADATTQVALATKPAFVDPQLQKAVDYLTQELARAQ
jgi:carboxyl-terminal processing protease